eukprot:TRINITY_DN156_c0_g1_i8.p1 TRINITY_DN156_c0_g1~~TRINITY_DN156_c0_g1_i8.p1  ORF type:complete len:212 (+),score=29.92 TRINITY_DN156_c0_g1_i8:947-1582(+)
MASSTGIGIAAGGLSPVTSKLSSAACRRATIASSCSTSAVCYGDHLAGSQPSSLRGKISLCELLPSPFQFHTATPVVRRNRTLICAQSVATGEAPTGAAAAPAITLTDTALRHLMKLKEGQNNEKLCLRVGVRQGGCSGMSYIMDFEDRANVRAEDAIIDYEGFTMVCDPKSLLFLFGMQLDYSNALIGGGFSFSNPNASSTCGCGKSFAA